MLTSLVSLQQGNVKKSKKLLKILANFAEQNLHIFWQIFRKDVTYDSIKIHKKSGFHPFSERLIFGKTKTSIWPPPPLFTLPAFLGLRRPNPIFIYFYRVVKYPIRGKLNSKNCWHHLLYVDFISLFCN